MGRAKQQSPTPSAAAEPPRRKKKGRPSLLDIQKRLLKQQKSQSSPTDQKNPNPSNPNRGNSRPDGPCPSSGDDDERLSKKHKLLQGIDCEDANHSSLDGLEGEKGAKGTVERYGSVVELGPTTPLPDKKLLVFILDRLQKKDTYGVFSEPVDPEELPDYHDVIKQPMDFGTVMKKLDDGEYSNLEQFEKDIFLICSNAMEYNAPDTVFFKQARTMQELARKDFENLRQDSDSEPQHQKVARRGRPPGSVQWKSLEKSPLDRIGNKGSSDATLANESASWSSNAYNLRREPLLKNFGPFESNGLISHRTPNSESHSIWFSEMETEFPGSVWRNVTKNGKRLTYAEEHRRETYNRQPLSRNEESPLGVFDKETKQLVMVGLQFERGYARSLARFAANLGSVARKIASRKIQSFLPPGVGFGPGWAGENENIVRPPQVDAQKCSTSSLPSKGPCLSRQDTVTMQRLKSASSLVSPPGDPRSVNASLLQNLPAVPNGLIPRFVDASQNPNATRSSNFIRPHAPKEEPCWDQQVSQMEDKQSSVPATIYDNNRVKHLIPGSSNPGLCHGPSQQPDLALQL